MKIEELLLATIEPHLPNVWAVDLPDDSAFPAIVFNVETTPETTWVQGGGYDRHLVTLSFFAETKEAVTTLARSIMDAIELRPEFLETGDFGDADFEDLPELFAYYSTHTLRMRT
ncbi:DUF3168 domain-containing protein [Methylophilus sp. Leaf414]|uniref:tail completion protein gp17 n=1 Tax=Methylophilus sp. Leaf414 TaxID=1736371 RepID=UPI000700AC1B|nr:DUF3168 domain-containing protein [Methylophilus sp. Leaf414]KQT37679.1 hypothetical protein ASG24_01400 [Methylophilus sp. Leaf414]